MRGKDIEAAKAEHAAWRNERDGISTAPVSAPLDTQALPPLPEADEYSATRMLVNGDLAPRFNGTTLRNFALSAIAPYAARIAHLERELKQAKLQQLADIGQDIERELAERKPVSIDAQKEAWDAAVATVRANSEKSDAASFVKVLMVQMLDSIDTFAQTTFAAAPSPQPKQEEA